MSDPTPNFKTLGWFLAVVYLTVAAVTLLLGDASTLIAGQ